MITTPDIPSVADNAVVLLSGGQDSTTCLYWALDTYADVAAVSFDYGQRHRVELNVAATVAESADVPHVILDVPALAQIGAAALTNDDIAVNADATGTGNEYAADHDLPSTFVPARNAILLATAAAWAAPNDARHIVTGVCEADDAGYPDCRGPFIASMEDAIRAALGDESFTIAAPLLHLDKARTFKLAHDLDVLSIVVNQTHTCYEGVRVEHPWGFGCGECPACHTRASGYAQFLDADGGSL